MSALVDLNETIRKNLKEVEHIVRSNLIVYSKLRQSKKNSYLISNSKNFDNNINMYITLQYQHQI